MDWGQVGQDRLLALVVANATREWGGGRSSEKGVERRGAVSRVGVGGKEVILCYLEFLTIY